jgi:septal ring factor EnvC (AmiA/AmiB activator)
MGQFKKILVFFALFLFVNTIHAQSLNELKKQKEKTAQEIEYINSLLQETGKNVRSSLNRLAVLEKSIILQSNLINNINSEIVYLDASISKSLRTVDSSTVELSSVKEKYAAMIRYARRNQDANNQLVFLLSAEDFNQAYKRFVYLRQYADYRRRQAEQISEVKHTLDQQIADFNKRKDEKQRLLTSKVKQTEIIEQQKVTTNEYYSDLQKKEKELKKKLENQRRAELRLQQEIERIIAEEAKKVAAKSKTEPGFVMTPEDKVLSGDFSKNQGKFPWPVNRGLITDHFGEHPHPVLKYVMMRNAGIDITTQAGEKARAIYKGEVSKVVAIPGGNMAVIIRHGNYLSVYSNLASVSVQTGQNVDTKQDIGTIFTDADEDNKTVLKFQIWRENIKLDPEQWIVR